MSDTVLLQADEASRPGDERVLLSGREALVRFPLVQSELDQRRGLHTAGYISGYRGSPLGGYDDALWAAAARLGKANVIFHPGINEDLALTAVAGTQQLAFLPDPKFDGVFGIWYGKGPGVDRSGDAIKHANLQGVAPNGGIVLIYGDDHTGKSSTTAHQSDLTLASWGVPTLYPSSVSEIMEMSLAAMAMSRYSGLLVGLKLVNETAEATEAVSAAIRSEFVVPDLPPVEGGVHIRPEILATQVQDVRLTRHKLPRASAFARSNRLDAITFGAGRGRLVIVTAGKAYPDVLAALSILGIDETVAVDAGIAVFKVAMIYPLDPSALADVSAEAEELLFVEEKRPHMEAQAATLLYGSEHRPRITGKTDGDGHPLLPSDLPLDPTSVALALAARIGAAFPGMTDAMPGFRAARAVVEARSARGSGPLPLAVRRPAFCPGCPHNLSTKVPAGSSGGTGIGCHGMASFHPERNPIPMGHMGAEGANWIGLSAFTATPHIFQNLGDGTYNHSGSLAIRAAVMTGTTITYKILFNDAVAMTGGQAVEGGLTVAAIVAQVRAEGVGRIVVLSEYPERFRDEPLPAGTELYSRDQLARVQAELREAYGVTVLIYDQICAAEKRRRRKIGVLADPDQRTFINALVCEGCGDCSATSNCLAIQPLETEVGRKRVIDQSACNKDFSCTAGFCPSFVTIEGAVLRKQSDKVASKGTTASGPLPDPILPPFGRGFDLVIAGIGGTGVVTVGALIGRAARIEGYDVHLFDMTGLSQKGGAVTSHVRIRPWGSAVPAAKVGAGEAQLVLASDLVAAAQPDVLATIDAGTRIVGSDQTVATAGFQLDRDLQIPEEAITVRLAAMAGRVPDLIPASRLALETVGDAIAANMLLLGYAWQLGTVPLALESIAKGIERSGRAATANRAAFDAGRRAAVEGVITAESEPQTLDDFVTARAADLGRYWNGAYSKRYVDLIAMVRGHAERFDRENDLAWAVARSAYKLMAYKDEYEVARLYSDGRFRAAIEDTFARAPKIRVHLAPPLMARTDPRTGHPRKIAFGGWILHLFGILSALKHLREGPFDPFGRTKERRLERTLRDTFEAAMRTSAANLTAQRLKDAIALAKAPLDVRGFGHVKNASATALLDRLEQSVGPNTASVSQ
ncbi:indolepyruvate ferredoxin oxidoreductase family protein [Sphingomonas sp. UV9]|uniref:indolepyruvate ferredoxin oxidoreductase family protein n=1 Tax=Sphingomonas sp. UV9 TaxID=1851410 RepID=UPI000FFBBEFC|nr:indolepyruvate ferredoxin oxidoreductase family protein [Sphingomonas sp. UV9]RXD04829.1 indolepyruvate ferredoxin oxidoreductase family protein [Sphingomonas sp. UV9]